MRIMPTTEISFAEIARADEEVERLFLKLFRASPPQHPRHFVVRHAGRLAAYVHYTDAEPGVFLIGGLGVDAAVYRQLTREERDVVSRHGSLSRWLLVESIAALGEKRAVFAYTGDTRSRRDIEALGFSEAAPPYLWVQWHSEPVAARAELVARIEARGPF